MKLASLYRPHHKDGVLCVVNKLLTKAIEVPDIAKTLQEALDKWDMCESELIKVYEKLNQDLIPDAIFFDPVLYLAPLPRAYQWADASAYVNHIELVRKARGADMPENFWTDPLMYQGGSDTFLGPREPIYVMSEAYGVDFEAEVAIIVDDVPMGITPEAAEKHIKLLMLVNDVSLRALIPDELAKGFGFFQSKPSSSFSPVAVTPDELGTHWDGKKLHLPIISTLNNQQFGSPNAGIDMTFHFGELIAHAAKTRELCAGSIIGSGTVSNIDKSTGSSCIVERRMIELLENGKSETPFMHYGDTIRIDMLDDKGQSIFGDIYQTVLPYTEKPDAVI